MKFLFPTRCLMNTCYTILHSWGELTGTPRHEMTHLKPLQLLSGRTGTQESQTPPKQSYHWSDPSWKENVASGSFSSSQVPTACGISEDICCCSWQRHNVLGREKAGMEERWKPPCSPMGEWTLLLFSMGADCCLIWTSDCLVIC